jgi:hypothetical protein
MRKSASGKAIPALPLKKVPLHFSEVYARSVEVLGNEYTCYEMVGTPDSGARLRYPRLSFAR